MIRVASDVGRSSCGYGSCLSAVVIGGVNDYINDYM